MIEQADEGTTITYGVQIKQGERWRTVYGWFPLWSDDDGFGIERARSNRDWLLQQQQEKPEQWPQGEVRILERRTIGRVIPDDEKRPT